MIGLDRLWEFTMRELVLVGAEGWVTEQRQRGLDAFIGLVDSEDVYRLRDARRLLILVRNRRAGSEPRVGRKGA